MKFNEKLIDLRKKNGMSQEELGNKLNVTRQTVSKWELGQTRPDMDKLKEISDLFNVDVNYLLSDDKLINNDKILENNKITQSVSHGATKNIKKNSGREKTVLSILVVILIICISSLLFLGIKNYNDNKKNNKGFFENFFGFFNKINDNIDKDFEESRKDNEEKYEYNKLEGMCAFNNSGFFTKNCINEIISLNNKGKNIDVVFGDKLYKLNDVENVRPLINEDYHYNIKLDYDGYKIIKVNIKREITEEDKKDHNFKLEFSYTGTKSGFFLKNMFDEIIKINKNDDKKVVLNFLGKNYYKDSEIRKLKTKLSSSIDYEVYHEYDKDGFINKTIVEEVR